MRLHNSKTLHIKKEILIKYYFFLKKKNNFNKYFLFDIINQYHRKLHFNHYI